MTVWRTCDNQASLSVRKGAVGGRLAPQAVDGGLRCIILTAAPENTPVLKARFLMFINISFIGVSFQPIRLVSWLILKLNCVQLSFENANSYSRY